MCVFTLEQSLSFQPVIVFEESDDAWSALYMLHDAFPNKQYSFTSTYIACWNGYDNCIVFENLTNH